MSRNKLYSERLEICITPKQKKWLADEANKKEITINELLREMIQMYFWK